MVTILTTGTRSRIPTPGSWLNQSKLAKIGQGYDTVGNALGHP